MKTLRVILGAVALSVSTSSICHAASQGDFDETSSNGSSTITMTIPKLYKVNRIDDLGGVDFSITEGFANGSSHATDSDTLCIYSNADSGQYDITLQGDGGAGNNEFSISDGEDDLPYKVYWNDSTGSRGSQVADGEVTAAGPVTPAPFSNASNLVDCNSTDNARVDVQFDREDVLEVGEGSYTGVLTISLSVATP
jgi:hypothetical protein